MNYNATHSRHFFLLSLIISSMVYLPPIRAMESDGKGEAVTIELEEERGDTIGVDEENGGATDDIRDGLLCEGRKSCWQRLKARCSVKKALVALGGLWLASTSAWGGYIGGYYNGPGCNATEPWWMSDDCTESIPLNYDHIGCEARGMFDGDGHILPEEIYWEWIAGCKLPERECAHLCKSWKDVFHGKEYYDNYVPSGPDKSKKIPCLKGESEVLICKKDSPILQSAKTALSDLQAEFCTLFSDDGQFEALVYPQEYYGSEDVFKESEFTEDDVTPVCRVRLDQAVASYGGCKKYDFEKGGDKNRSKYATKVKRKLAEKQKNKNRRGKRSS